MENLISKEDLLEKLKKIVEREWIPITRSRNDGRIGNTLEDLLGIEENNLAIPNANEWELKTQRWDTSSLVTLFHFEPSPRKARIVPKVLLPLYGWPHAKAGDRYGKNEMSFRQTISAINYTSRGFKIDVLTDEKKIVVVFDARKVANEHKDWLESVKMRVGLGQLEPEPYWGFRDLAAKASLKLLNTIFVLAEQKKESGTTFVRYTEVHLLENFSFEKFIQEIKNGNILIDFDARTGHNHGTKFRVRPKILPDLYEKNELVIP